MTDRNLTPNQRRGRKGRPWQRTRQLILARDGYRCQIRGPRCTGTATTVDHIIPLEIDDTRALDPTNLRAACGPCNYGHWGHNTTRQPSRRWLP